MSIKTEQEISAMRQSGQILAKILRHLTDHTTAQMTTQDVAVMAQAELKALGGQPVLLGYQGFPSVICISINDEVVHGIPGTRILKKGDLISLDFCVGYDGMITDAATTFVVDGPASVPMVSRLLQTTEESLYQGIEAVRAGAHVGDIGQAVEQWLSKDQLGIVVDLVGHGVGHSVHEPPEIPNIGPAGSGPILKTGMTIAIEPMATLGSGAVYLGQDGWTFKTKDGSLSAHFEHTVLVTNDGYEILTSL